MAHDAVGFEHDVIPAGIHLALEHLDIRKPVLPAVPHDFSDKEVFQDHLTVGGMDAVLGCGHAECPLC